MSVNPGQMYKHYKGTLYVVLCVATEVNENSSQESTHRVVVYQNAMDRSKIWTRALDVFCGTVIFQSRIVKRFELVDAQANPVISPKKSPEFDNGLELCL